MENFEFCYFRPSKNKMTKHYIFVFQDRIANHKSSKHSAECSHNKFRAVKDYAEKKKRKNYCHKDTKMKSN